MYKTVIGLEVHCELKSNSKNFSSARNSYSTIPNSNVSVVDLGMPGILPVVNKEAVKNSIKMALAMNCEIPEYLTFERKNYFYPDLPKGYQITQFKHPIGINGYVMINVNGEDKKVLIHDTHLEEDTASLDHYNTYSLLDYNRCGVPLLETVTEPCLNSADEAVAFLEGLRSIFLYCDTSYARSDRGQIRCDVNVSLMREGDTELGTKVEMKNINSFSSVREAIICEVKRQTEILNRGEKVLQETRRFDEVKGETYSMRSKEDAIDYRYFPDPDLAPLYITDELIEELKKEMPELPEAKKARYISEYGLSEYDAGVLTASTFVSSYFETVVAKHDPKLATNWITSELFGRLNKMALTIENSPVSAEMLIELLDLIKNETISGKIAKDVLDIMIETKQTAGKIVEEKGLKQVVDTGAIEKVIDEVIANNPKQVEQYKGGNERLFGFFVGQTMKASGGKVNPKVVNEILKKKLG